MFTQSDMVLTPGYGGVTLGVTWVLQCQGGSSLDLQFVISFWDIPVSGKRSVSLLRGGSGSTAIVQGCASSTFPVTCEFPEVAQ